MTVLQSWTAVCTSQLETERITAAKCVTPLLEFLEMQLYFFDGSWRVWE